MSRTRLLLALAAPALLGLALPATAAGPATAPCAAVEGATTLAPGAPAEEEFSAPLLPGAAFTDAEQPVPAQSSAFFRYVVDLSGDAGVPDAGRATYTLQVGWTDDTDFDVYVTDAAGRSLGDGASFNPLSGSGETVSVGSVRHCTELVVEVRNYVGTPGQPMTASSRLSGLKA